MNRLLSDYLARYNKSALTTGVISLVLGVGLALVNANFGYNALCGPFTATIADLQNFKSSNLFQKYFFVVKGEEVVHTGLAYQKVSRRSKYDKKSQNNANSDDDSSTSDSTPEYYVDLLIFDEHLVPIKTMHKEKNPVIVGELKSPADSVIAALRSSAPSKDIGEKIMNVELEQSDTFKALFWALMLVVAGLCAYGLVKVMMVQIAWKDLEKHPLGKAIGKAGGFNSMRIEIEQDFDHLSSAEATRKVVCGKKWLLIEERNTPAFIPIKNVVWVYATNSATSRFFVTTNVYSLVICTTDGVEHKIAMLNKDVDEMVVYIGKNAPWAMVGFEGSRALRWNAHKQKLIAEIEQRRDQLLRKA